MKNDENEGGFKYTRGGRKNNEPDLIGKSVGVVLSACVVVLAVAGTIALAKWMLGF